MRDATAQPSDFHWEQLARLAEYQCSCGRRWRVGNYEHSLSHLRVARSLVAAGSDHLPSDGQAHQARNEQRDVAEAGKLLEHDH
jgi:hypothetical protein